MAPSPQGCNLEEQMATKATVPRPSKGDEVVISGMSGIFPSSKSVQEFMENLYNEVDMVTPENTRWQFDHPDVPSHLGLIEGMNKFDAQFFRVHYKQAVTLEPTCRKMLEHAYSAIFDAGVNPVELRGRKIGVFIGASISESEKVVQYDTIQVDGFGITGTNKSMFANRISYWLDAKGPSYALDAACSSSMLCIEHAYRSIISGQCEGAIVGGCNLCLQPFIQLNMRRIGFLTADGKTKCFDKHGDGYVRADAISVLFLQKARDANRIYSEIYHAKTQFNDYTENYIPVRKPEIVKGFLDQFYNEIDVSPKEVEYIEANAPGIAEVDRAELQIIGEMYCKGSGQKLIGSVKSNMGNSEAASGVCAITKACIAYEKGEIPANLHYADPQDVDVIHNGQLKVVTAKTPFNRSYIALNTFSYTGVNVHVLLKGHYKEKNTTSYRTRIPYLVTASGRQESAVCNLLKALSTTPIDAEAIGLLHRIHKSNISGHTCRGYTVLDTNDKKETISLTQGVEYSSGINRPIWFVYSGMGSQWAGMGRELLRIPIFASSIERCRKVLEPKGVDLMYILTKEDKSIYDNILNSFVGIAAVQIGLTDLLQELGIVPDNIIGHSVGELGCAYADGCFTAEEMILAAYSRGLVSVQTPFIRGSMAAVGLGYKTVLPLLPPEIEVACHNSSESSTISGPADVMKKFVSELSARGIFAKEVPCSNIAYHSRYIADAGPGLLKYLTEVIKEPKLRSEKWLSTSVPQDKWNDPIAKYCSAEYHTNNLLNSVLFEETSKLIPSNAILIEVAPHGLLQAILKRSLPDTCVHIPLTRRGHADPITFLFDAFGRLYQNGLNPKVDVLYPKIEFPVSTGTPFLSQLVEWEHSESWTLATYNKKIKVKAGSREYVISVHDDDYKYLEHHFREGLNIYPEAGILVKVWETLGLLQGVAYENLSVTFHDVRFYNEAVLRRDVPLIMNVEIHKGTQYFEVSCDDVCIASGFIYAHKKFFHRIYKDADESQDKVNLTADDVYTMFALKGHFYSENFQSIRSSNTTFDKALLKWDNEWATFIDAMIQLKAMKRNHNGVSVPNYIQKLSIDVKKQYLSQHIPQNDHVNCYEAIVYDVYSTTRCGGVDIVGINFIDKPNVGNKTDVVAKQEFVPNFPDGILDISAALSVVLQILSENVFNDKIIISEVITENPIASLIRNVAKSLTINVNVINNVINDTGEIEINHNVNALVIDNLLHNQKNIISLYEKLEDNQFVLTREPNDNTISNSNLFVVVSVINIGKESLILLKKCIANDDEPTFMSFENDSKFEWVFNVLVELRKGRRVILVSEDKQAGLLGIAKSLQQEFRNRLAVIIKDKEAPAFDKNNDIYKERINKNLCINIFKKEKWGGYYTVPTKTTTEIQDALLTSAVPGDLDSLHWVENQSKASHNLIQVYYAGVSVRDVGRADGRILVTDVSKQNIYGMDYCGLNNRGQRVMGIVDCGSINCNVEADPDLLWPIPQHWSLEDAATVPLAYVQAFYCLMIRSSLESGSTVLIHGGAGALGQAAISICLANNCTVYTTVSNIRKKKMLLRLFPQLNDRNIGNSRDNSFEDLVMSETRGLGCNIIICCMEGWLQKASMRCLALRGHILFVNHRDMQHNSLIGMAALSAEHNCNAVSISSIFKDEFSHEKKLLNKLIREGISNGTVRPLTRITFMPSEVSRAFRLVGASCHCGRVLIRLRGSSTSIQSSPRLSLNSQNPHIIICENQMLGIELADRLISRGARKLIFHMNSKLFNGYFYTKMLSWEKLGVFLKISSENLQDLNGCVNLLRDASELGAVEGIYVTLSSKCLTRITNVEDVTQFHDITSIVSNLDKGARNLQSLKYFVVINSDRNAILQSIVEDICRNRNYDRLPVLSLQYCDEWSVNSDNVVFSDVKPHKISSILNTMETSLRLNYPVVVLYNVTMETVKLEGKIAGILGVNNLDEINGIQLEQVVGIDHINMEEIINYLKAEFGVIYAEEVLNKSTIAELRAIPQNIKNSRKFNRLTGLEAFINYVDPDEFQATEPVVPMNTKLSNFSDPVDEIDKSSTYLMLIPGYEGHHRIFHKVCERLKIQAVTLQLQPDYVEETVPETAQRIFEVIKKRFVLNSKFYLLGYSFGVLIALEVAALLEKEGLTGTVFCLDSSPDVLQAQLKSYLGDIETVTLQNSIVEHMYRLMHGKDVEDLREDLKKLDNWSHKVEACVVRLRSVVTYSNQYKRSLIQMAYKRIEQALNYRPKLDALRSQIALLRSVQRESALPKDYGLSKYSHAPVKIYDIELDNASAPDDLRCSNIINCVLDSDVLEEFKQKFTCDVYCADAENLF